MKQPLCKWTLINTRPLAMTTHFDQEFRRLGGTIISMPSLKIKPLPATWLNHMPLIEPCDYIIFTSRNAVIHALLNLAPHQIDQFKQTKVIAIGQATKKELSLHSVKVDNIPSKSDSEHLLKLSELTNICNKRVIIFKGIGGRPLLHEQLEKRGAQIEQISVYERVKFRPINMSWQKLKKANAILFTSVEGMINALEWLSKYDNVWVMNITCIAFSERIARKARALGMKNTITLENGDVINTLLAKGKPHGSEIQKK
jgi:uroporphyrinogen-III synthase